MLKKTKTRLPIYRKKHLNPPAGEYDLPHNNATVFFKRTNIGKHGTCNKMERIFFLDCAIQQTCVQSILCFRTSLHGMIDATSLDRCFYKIDKYKKYDREKHPMFGFLITGIYLRFRSYSRNLRSKDQFLTNTTVKFCLLTLS